jgi:hypothetical protein
MVLATAVNTMMLNFAGLTEQLVSLSATIQTLQIQQAADRRHTDRLTEELRSSLAANMAMQQEETQKQQAETPSEPDNVLLLSTPSRKKHRTEPSASLDMVYVSPSKMESVTRSSIVPFQTLLEMIRSTTISLRMCLLPSTVTTFPSPFLDFLNHLRISPSFVTAQNKVFPSIFAMGTSNIFSLSWL